MITLPAPSNLATALTVYVVFRHMRRHAVCLDYLVKTVSDIERKANRK